MRSAFERDAVEVAVLVDDEIAERLAAIAAAAGWKPVDCVELPLAAVGVGCHFEDGSEIAVSAHRRRSIEVARGIHDEFLVGKRAIGAELLGAERRDGLQLAGLCGAD